MSLTDNFTAYSSYSQALSSTTVAVALTVIRSSLYQNSDLTSETLTIDFRNLPCPPSGCEYVVEIPNRDQLDLSRDNIGQLVPGVRLQNFTLYCQKGSYINETLTCANGDIQVAQCSGKEGTIFVDCPHYLTYSRCMGLDSQNNLLYEGT